MQYIVTCPRAASPFAEALKTEAYPQQYLTSAVTLGLTIMRITENFFADENSFADGRRRERERQRGPYIKVGIAHGPAAGAVVGTVRAFYCIYGDTINTAARMCMLAKRGEIHSTGAFMHLLFAAGFANENRPTAVARECGSILDTSVSRAKRSTRATCECLLDVRGRGEIYVKGKGHLFTFDIRGWKAEGASICARAHCRRILVDLASKSLHVLQEATSPLEQKYSEVHASKREGGGGGMIIDELDLVRISDLSTVGKKFMERGRFEMVTGVFSGCRFAHARVEAKFQRAYAGNYQRDYAIFLMLHCALVSFQFFNVVYAQFDVDFAALGAPQIQAQKLQAFALLRAHLICVGTLAIVPFFTDMQVPSVRGKALTRAIVLVLRLAWIFSGCYISLFLWPKDGLLLSFCAISSLVAGQMLPDMWDSTLVQVVALFTILPILLSKPHYSGEELMKFVAITLGCGYSVYCVSHTTQRQQRRNWRLIQLLVQENKAMHRMVRNLLPRDIADAMCLRLLNTDVPAEHTEDGERVLQTATERERERGQGAKVLLDLCSHRRVVVLQVDICKWTEMSSTLQPLALAKIVNMLFCDFDIALSKTKMFKVDNMGDAYLCCGWLPDRGALGDFNHSIYSAHKESVIEAVRVEREMIHAALYVARSILTVVERCRQDDSMHLQDLHVRIGIGTGTCVAGVMGRLQPRFHMLGPAVASANRLEQTAPKDRVHISPLIMSLLLRTECSRTHCSQGLYEGALGMGLWELQDGEGTWGSSRGERGREAERERQQQLNGGGANVLPLYQESGFGYVLAAAAVPQRVPGALMRGGSTSKRLCCEESARQRMARAVNCLAVLGMGS